MRTTRARILKFRHSHLGRFRPPTELNNKELVIDKIITSLYKPHLGFFQKRLAKIIETNMYIQGRTGEPRTYGITYAGRSWFIPWMEGLTEVDYHNLAADPGLDETELLKVTTNLTELDVEMYEVKRFLTGLISFSAPIAVLEERLGRSLFNRVKTYLAEIEGTALWNEATHKAFNTYADKHDYLIDAMCKRIMMTMLSRNAFNQR